MTNCSFSKKAAQTLFLGASVANINTNMGWGGQPSQLTVTLIEDQSPFCTTTNNGDTNILPQFTSASYADHHYHTCESETACYIDSYDAGSVQKIVPGKVYYVWNGSSYVSRYWFDPDPGFFGNGTKIDENGGYDRNTQTLHKYDIINTPVYFRIGDFQFIGIVRSWDRDYGSGGLKYTVVIDSIDSILADSHLILDKYGGSIFSKLSTASYGAPSNFIGSASLSYKGTIVEGAIPNVFNVYGFLESSGFGGSGKNDQGISVSLIRDAIKVLCSADGVPGLNLEEKQKRAFSPFGRILVKCMQNYSNYNRIGSGFDTYGMGVFPYHADDNGIRRNMLALDLSDLPITPINYRIKTDSMSILDFVQQVTSDTGRDFLFETIPAFANCGEGCTSPYNVLKLRCIDRTVQIGTNKINDTIDALASAGYNVSTSRVGKEKNNNVSRMLYIGANQQRLYQASSYRLGFTQSTFIFNPINFQWVDHNQYLAGKVRMPSGMSIRNPGFTYDNANLASLISAQTAMANDAVGAFTAADATWADTNISGSVDRQGNYGATVKSTSFIPPDETWESLMGTDPSTQEISNGFWGRRARFIPLAYDVISPFFGYVAEDTLPTPDTSTDADNPVFKSVRPVFLDAWTGQLMILFRISELPRTIEASLLSLYTDGVFVVSESEIRCAMVGWDSYLTYCMGKTFKPDLYRMLINAYRGSSLVTDLANNKVPDPYQSLADGGNMAGQFGQPVSPNPQNLGNINMGFEWILNPDMLRDFQKLSDFIASVGQKYYGSQYLVRLPNVTCYRDFDSSAFSVTYGTDTITAYQGSGKIFYDFEPAPDGAWEEYGNIIDEDIVVGSPYWYALSEDNGKIPTILGYNAKSSFDYVSWSLCNFESQIQSLGFQNFGALLAVLNAAYFAPQKTVDPPAPSPDSTTPTSPGNTT